MNDIANGGKIELNGASTVIYNASANQQIAKGFTYGSVILRATGATTPVIKTIFPVVVLPVVATDEIRVTNQLIIEEFNYMIDAGNQIKAIAGGNPKLEAKENTKLFLGNQTIATRFPTVFVRNDITLSATNPVSANAHETIYISDVAQTMSTEPEYANLTLEAPNLTLDAMVEKRFSSVGTPSNLSDAYIRGNLLIKIRNYLLDDGNQIRGLNGLTQSFTMKGDVPNQGRSWISLGENTFGDVATQFPTFFENVSLEDSTTVVYNAGSVVQSVRGTGLNVMTALTTQSYYNLIIQSGVKINAIKRLQEPMRIRNDFTIRRLNRFEDNKQQVTGSTIGTMRMEESSNLYIGINTGAAPRSVFPTNYSRPRIILNNNATTPSTVRYLSRGTGANIQKVSSEPIYSNLFLTSGNTSAGANIVMQVDPNPLVVPSIPRTEINVTRNLTVDYRVRFEDMGVQIVGNTTNTLLVNDGSELVLGVEDISTLFPTNFVAANINLKPTVVNKTTVIYNSGVIGNNISGLPNYGNLTLNNARATGTITKNLLGDINVFGNLLVRQRNVLETTTNNYNINLKGNWTVETNGVFNSQAGRVILSGNSVQQLRTNSAQNQKFYELEANAGLVGSFRMFDNVIIKTGGKTIFNNGLFVPNDVGLTSTIKMVFEANATVGGTGTYTPASWVNISAPALSANGPSNVSHVVGKVEKQGTDAFMFPIGNGVNYAPAGLGVRNNSTYEIRYVGPRFPTTDGYDVTLKEPTIYGVSNVEYWRIDPINGTTSTSAPAYVYLSWDNPRSVAYQPEGLKVLRWNGALWTDKFLGGHSNASAKGVIASQNVVTEFSPFTLGTINQFNPLPLDLLSFDAKIEGESVKVSWETTNEIDNSHFMVQRSQDGNSFGTLGRVNAKGTGLEGTFNYQFWDAEPFENLSYYRLKMFDLNGDFKYSPIRSVLFEKVVSGVQGEISLYPNPNGGARFYLNLNGILTTDAKVQVIDMVGRTVHTQDVQKGGDNIIITPNRTLPAGTYILRFVTPIETITKKFVVE